MAERMHRHGRQTTPPPLAGYYGLPALKASHWKWMVALYIWIAGLAGALQVLAALVLLVADDAQSAMQVTRPARYGALLAAIAGAGLLIADLKTPKRFLNMLRIFRRTSPMSFGSYVLVAFSGFTAVTAAVQGIVDLRMANGVPRWLDLAVQLPAAALGLLMLTYTAPLLSATSTPLWARSPALLAGTFAGFSMAAGASALTLWGLAFGGAPYAASFELIALLSLGAAWVLLLAWVVRMTNAQLLAPLVHGSTGWIFVAGVLGFGLLLPVLAHLLQIVTAERLLWVSVLAAVAELTGSLLWRGALLLGGRTSALRPADALRFAGGNPYPTGTAVAASQRDVAHARSGAAYVRSPQTEPEVAQGGLPRWLIGGLSLGGLGAALGIGMALAA